MKSYLDSRPCWQRWEIKQLVFCRHLPQLEKSLSTTLRKENALFILNSTAHIVIVLNLIVNLFWTKYSITRAFTTCKACFNCVQQLKSFNIIKQKYSFTTRTNSTKDEKGNNVICGVLMYYQVSTQDDELTVQVSSSFAKKLLPSSCGSRS